jgi:hypothetical protein
VNIDQLRELKRVIQEKLVPEIVNQAIFLNVEKYPKPRFVLEFDYTGGTLKATGVEVRYRRPLS